MVGKKCLATFAGVVMLLSNSSVAQTCEGYRDKQLTTSAFVEATRAFKTLAPRGEFETSAQHAERQSRALSGMPATVIVRKAPDDGVKHLPYDADAGELHLLRYAFNNRSFFSYEALRAAKIPLQQSPIQNVPSIVVETVEEATGAYEAQNAYGAKTTVAKVARRIAAIVDPAAVGPDRFSPNFFATADRPPYLVGKIKVTPEEAKVLRENLVLAFVVAPAPPYYAASSYPIGRVTVANPREIVETAEMLFGDVTCALVIDGRSNRVIASYETR